MNVVWFDNRDLNYEIYYKRSIDAGESWGADTRLTNNTAWSLYPSISVSGQVVHVVWNDERDFNNEIYYKRSTDAGVSWGFDTRLTNNTALSWFPSVSVSGSSVHVVWQDHRDDNSEIYYKLNPTGNPVSILNVSYELPTKFSLYQNFPNPFNPTTSIKFDIQKTTATKLIIYDALGREVTTLVNEQLSAGSYQVDWPAPTGDGSNYTSGVYFYTLQAGDYKETKKMLLLK